MVQNSFVVVTGASSGIGREIARVLSARGFSLILVARRKDRLEELAHELKNRDAIDVTVMPADLTHPQEVERLVASLKDLSIKGVVNNAGFGFVSEFSEAPWSRYAEMIQLNVTTLVRLTHGLLPQIKNSSRGFILNVASTAAFQPIPYFNIYAATKAFVLSFTEALNHELRGTTVTATVLCPGPTESEFHSGAGTESSALFKLSGKMATRPVAEQGVDGALKGRPVVIPGVLNALLVFIQRFMPRRATVAVSGRLMRSLRRR